MYYLDGIDTSLKHSIITYFLLDVLALLDASNVSVLIYLELESFNLFNGKILDYNRWQGQLFVALGP